MVRLKRNKETLELKIKGISKFASMKSMVRIPFSSIDEVRVNLDDSIAIWPGVRLPGTHLPGVIVAGTFLTKHGKHFYLRSRGNESIIIELRNHNFSRVVVDVSDPIDAVSQILTWVEEWEGKTA